MTDAADTPAVPAFTDRFDCLDPARWAVSAPHVLGRSRTDPARVRVAEGRLVLDVLAGSTDGAEVRTVAALPGGTYRARLRAADAPDSVTGFFLYAPPDYAHEIDVELYDDPRGVVKLTTYDAEVQTHSVDVNLTFDPTADVHEYAITRGPGLVEFHADGQLLASWRDGVPAAPMNLYLNTWFPQWLGGRPPITDRVTSVESVVWEPG